ncbi:MAG: VanZ family protein, partial [Calditrichaeota bacterium]
LRTFHHHIDLLRIPVGMYLVYLIYAGLMPFDFRFTLAELKSEMALNNLVPFYAYFKSASLFHIADLVNGLVSFMPVTLYWSARLRARGLNFSDIYPRTVLAGLALGLFIELAQLFSPARVAEITDVLNFALSGGLGTWVLRYYETEVRPQLALYRQGLIRL